MKKDNLVIYTISGSLRVKEMMRTMTPIVESMARAMDGYQSQEVEPPKTKQQI